MADSAASADQKAGRLAECVAAGRTLLVLDGVEPPQHPRRNGGMEGRFKHTGIERLLKRLAQLPGAGGLCVLTTKTYGWLFSLVGRSPSKLVDRQVRLAGLRSVSPDALHDVLEARHSAQQKIHAREERQGHDLRRKLTRLMTELEDEVKARCGTDEAKVFPEGLGHRIEDNYETMLHLADLAGDLEALQYAIG